MQKYYIIEVSVSLEESLSNSIELAAIQDFGSTGVEDFSLEESQVDDILGERSYSGGDIPVEILNEVEGVVHSENLSPKKMYFNIESEAKSFQEYLIDEHQLKSKILEMDTLDWNQEWRKSYKPISVGPKLDIVPSWQKGEYVSQAEKQLYIYPGMGFGTGSHETTFLCLKLFLETKYSGDHLKCIDFGCGSGILGLGLHLFNAKAAIDFYDIDQEALDNTVQNVELNEFSDKNFRLFLPDRREEFYPKYEIIFANILKNILELEGQSIVDLLSQDGYLILSGLLNGQEEDIIPFYENLLPTLKVLKVEKKGDWVAILLQNSI